MPTPTFERLPDEKKQRIIQAAINEFAVRNIVEAKLLNISKNAGISKGSIYQYFPSKEDLYIYIIEYFRKERAEYVQQAFDLYRKAPFFDFFEELYIRDSEYLFLNPIHVEIGKQLYSCSSEVSKKLVQSQQMKYRDWILVGIEFDKEYGIINPAVNSSTLAEICTYLLTSFLAVKTPGLQLSINNIKEHCHDMLLIIKNGALRR